MGMLLTYHDGYYPDAEQAEDEKPARKPRKRAEKPAEQSDED